MCEGADNTIHPQYSADICLQRAEAERRLDASLSANEFEAIGNLIRTAFEPRPRSGITYEMRILLKVLAMEKRYPIDPALNQLNLERIQEYGLDA